MSITAMRKTFLVSFQICGRLFVIITMTSLMAVRTCRSLGPF